jgi:acyl carrier protein
MEQMTESLSVVGSEVSSRIAQEVRSLLRERLPSHWALDPLADGLRLDESGLGLDSVALVELVVACERRFAVRLPAAILRHEAPTLGELIGWLRDAGA